MNLRNIAARKITEKLEPWDPVSRSFLPGYFRGRVEITDRFLSNFNKPLRRRMLFTRFGERFPESRTFRHPGTGDVYLIGQTRSDATDGNPVVSLTVCHLVTAEPGGSSGVARLLRKAPLGPSDDPGWLVESEAAVGYADIEFRTSSNEPDTYDVKVENFLCVMASYVRAEPWDTLELNGTRYRVVDTYADSGLSGMRIDREEDPRFDFVLHTDTGRQYDRASHSYTSIARSYNVTGVMPAYRDFAAWSDDSEPYVDLVIERDHIGFTPEAGKCWAEVGGRKRAVKSVSAPAGDRQYRLRCY